MMLPKYGNGLFTVMQLDVRHPNITVQSVKYAIPPGPVGGELLNSEGLQR